VFLARPYNEATADEAEKHMPSELDKPLSPDEQRVLEEMERRLLEEDPRLARAVASLSSHVATRIRRGALAFIVGFVMLMLFPISLWIAVAGFGVMLAAALLIYQQFKRLGRDQIRDWSRGGRFSLTAFLARLTERFRGNRRDRG
jgi:ABC-type bacteriocin/lantibiotic exporter with double-glycine peptidase domain